jgi:hypothetical protein
MTIYIPKDQDGRSNKPTADQILGANGFVWHRQHDQEQESFLFLFGD